MGISQDRGIRNAPCGTSSLDSRGWTPYCLRRRVFSLFLLVETTLLVGLILLFRLDQKHDGLVTTTSSLQYLWTYGPTAFLSLISALWARVEYSFCQIEPWRQLGSGRTPATCTLLLDYVSVSRPEALVRSLRLHHRPVVIVISSSLLLKVLTVFSAGLLAIEYTSIEHNNLTLLAADRFDPAAFLKPSDGYYDERGYLLPAIGTQIFNLTFPAGTSQDFAMPSLKTDNGSQVSRNLTASVTVNTFHQELICEPATLFPNATKQCDNNTFGSFTSIHFQVASPSCNMPNVTLTLTIPDFSDTAKCSSPNFLLGMLTSQNCNDNRKVHNSSRILMTTGFFRSEAPGSPIVAADNLVAYVCEVVYDVSPRTAKIDSDGQIISVRPQTTKHGHKLLGNITSSSLTNRLLRDLTSSQEIEFGALSSLPSTVDVLAKNTTLGNNTHTLLLDDFFTILTAISRPKTLDFLLDHDAVLESSKRLYSLLSVQFAKSHLMSSSSDRITGVAYTVEPRLRVQRLSSYGMIASTAVWILLTGLLFAVAPRAVISRDPGSIGGFATILARSQALCEVLSHSGLPSTTLLHESLLSKSCQTITDSNKRNPEFKIGLLTSRNEKLKHNSATTQPLKSAQPEWWNPWQLRTVFKLSLLIFLVALISALAVLAGISSTQAGIGFVQRDGYVQYAWTYIPTVTLIVVQSWIDGLGSTYQILLPYYQLRRRASETKHALFSNHRSRLTIHNLSDSLFKKQWALAMSSLSMLLAPLLTTVASGLYSAHTIQLSTAVRMTPASVFNSSFYSQAETSGVKWKGFGTELLVNTIHTFNLPQPPWTYGSYAFDEIYGTDDSTTISAGDNLVIQVPAVRASVDCTKVSSTHLNITFLDGELEGWRQVLVKWEVSDLSQCSTNNLTLSLPPNTSIPHASTTWLPFDTRQGENCPSLVVIYGLINKPSTNFSLLTCTVPVDQIQVEATFSPPDYRILSAVPDEGTVRSFTNISNAYVEDFWGIGPHLIASNLAASESLSNPYDSIDSITLYQDMYLDYTFSYYLHGTAS